MKTYIILLALLITSCRTGRHFERSRTNTLSETQHRSSNYTWQQLDSNNRYWLYWGDSAFYYHPDRGLYAAQGKLWVEESQRHHRIKQSSDSNFMHKQQDNSSKRVRSKSYTRYWPLWLIVGMILLLFFSYKIREIQKN